jgi:DNA-binding MarR family transcriptional regulator
MKSNSIVPVVSLWEEFSAKHPAGNIQSFARWLLEEKQEKAVRSKGSRKRDAPQEVSEEITYKGKAMLLIYRLHRFLEIRSKPAIKKIGFAKPHEFAMLAEIYLLKKPNKKEVAEKMLLESSTAVEISKRLVQRGLVKEISDAVDRRATRLVVTEKGMKKLHESYVGLENVHANFLDCLSEAEKAEMLRLLEELERFQSALTESDKIKATKTANDPA